MYDTFKIGDLVSYTSSGQQGIVIDTDLRRDHSYLDREWHLNVLVPTSNTTMKQRWVRSFDCVLVQSGR
jgi:hypothetical protein